MAPAWISNAGAVVALISAAIQIWQWLAAVRFPLHSRQAARPFRPGITVFKPLKGADGTTYGSLKSWFVQNETGPVQLLFGVHSEEDPVTEVVLRLIREFPNHPAKLVICSHLAGTNAKVSTLVQLLPHAVHDVFVVSDGDVRIPDDFLAEAVQPLSRKSVGLVNALYRLAAPTNLAMEWEAAVVNADFWSQVLQSRTIERQDFALGAAMLLRRDDLLQAGGFQSLLEFLADDFQLGRRIHALGREIELSTVPVECWDGPMSLAAAWKHQVRWARTIRVCRPASFAASAITHTGFWGILAVGVATQSWQIAVALSVMALRWAVALDLRRRMKDPLTWLRFVAPLIRDVSGMFVWMAAFGGNRVEWRGRTLIVNSSGRLTGEASD